MKKLNKVLSVLLAVLMMFSAISIAAVAAGTYTVKYHKNGGTGTVTTPVTYTVGVEQALSDGSKLTRTGYDFVGWAKSKTATEPEFGNEQVVVDIAEAGATLTLYAVWKPHTYYVEYRANGGDGTMPNQEFTYGVAQNLSANTFTREDYSFVGWSKNGTSTVSYDDQESVKNLTTSNDATVVLYAVWKRDPITVKAIEITTMPTKTEYFVGDALDATGLSLLVTKSNNTVQTVTTGYTLSDVDMTTAGEKVVTVTYEGQTATFTINVVEKPAEPEYNYTFSIVAPENKEVAHGDGVVLSAKLEGTYPEGVYVGCTANNNNFVATLNADGSYTVTADGVGATVFTATLYAADGTVLAQDSVELVALAEEVAEDPTEPGDPTDPEEPTGEVDIMAVLMGALNWFVSIIKKIIAFVMGFIA